MSLNDIKASMVIACREAGDSGGQEDHRRAVDDFMDALGTLFTDLLIETMPVELLRVLYLSWYWHVMQSGHEQARRKLAAHVWVSREQRPLPEKLPVNVVGLFSQTRH